MPRYNSIDGKWFAAQEDIYVDYGQSKFKSNRGRKSFHHSGADRAATHQLEEAGEEFFGMDVANDPQLLEVAQKYNTTVDDYLKRFRPTQKQLEAQKKEHSKINNHLPPEPKPGVKPAGGGVTQRGKFAEDGEMPA